MAPRKRKTTDDSTERQILATKKISKVECERKICKKKLDALELEETQNKDDRFNAEEKCLLLQAYNEKGFHIFQDMKALNQYLPNRRECDLKGLVERLRISLQANKELKSSKNDEPSKESHIDDWQRLCQRMMGNYARDNKVNLNDVFVDALLAEVDDMILSEQDKSEAQDSTKPNYPMLLKSFAQLIMGKFPDGMTGPNARLSRRLFEHLNHVVDTMDVVNALPSLVDGTWLNSTVEPRHQRQVQAAEGLKELDKSMKKCPTMRDIEKSRNIEALCLELPKIKRITDVLNPLHINESLVSTLVNSLL